jgi:hypothetical protein
MAEKTFPERFRADVLSLTRLVAERWKVLAGSLVLVVALAGGLGAWWWQSSRREGEAGQALAEVNQAFRRQYPAGFYLPGGEKEDPKPDGLIERYRQVADTYAGTQAGAEARLRVADLEYSAGQYDSPLGQCPFNLWQHPDPFFPKNQNRVFFKHLNQSAQLPAKKKIHQTRVYGTDNARGGMEIPLILGENDRGLTSWVYLLDKRDGIRKINRVDIGFENIFTV